MRKILEACPTCGSEMIISEVTCTTCDTVVRSRYSPCPFCRLAPEELAFMLLFVRSRGNVKDMERELGVSYWTIRGRLNEVIASMGLEATGPDDGSADGFAPAEGEPPAAPAASTAPARGAGSAGKEPGRAAAAPVSGRPSKAQAILARLQRGEISAQEAAELLARQ